MKFGNLSEESIQHTVPDWKLDNVDTAEKDEKHIPKSGRPKQKSKKLNIMGGRSRRFEIFYLIL